MPFEIVMPRLGWSMEKGVLVKWFKQDGEYVRAGEPIFMVEADKANQDVEALESGVLRIPSTAPGPGATVPVGTLLGYLLQPGEQEPSAPPSAQRVSGAGSATTLPAVAPTPASIAPRRPTRGPAISPRARRVAREMGVQWRSLTGSGRTGRIVERDVRLAVANPPGGVTPQPAHHAPTSAQAKAAPVPMTLAWPGVGQRIAGSASAAVVLTLTTEVDATELVQLRRRFSADVSQPTPSHADLLVRLVAQALVEHPAMNARLEGEAIVQSAAVHLSLAVDTVHGRRAPVLRDVQSRPLLQVAREAAALIEAARAERIEPDDLLGGTFTLANLGMYDIDAFTPIINSPECATLGVGRIIPKQVVTDADTERVAIRHMMFLSLAFDRRLVAESGAPAARFLQRVKQYIEQPYLLLMA